MKGSVKNNHRNGGRGRQILAVLFVLCLVMAGTAALTGTMLKTRAADKNQSIEYKYYTSICLERGDSLWKLAEEYMGEHYDNQQDYIEEVRELNNLTSEEVQEGQYLTIPYFSEEFL